YGLMQLIDHIAANFIWGFKTIYHIVCKINIEDSTAGDEDFPGLTLAIFFLLISNIFVVLTAIGIFDCDMLVYGSNFAKPEKENQREGQQKNDKIVSIQVRKHLEALEAAVGHLD
ncbi:hypothetical protein ACJX0J_008165, partial [Zea mays]